MNRIILFTWLTLCIAAYGYQVPQATVQVNSPMGFEVSIPDQPGISLFAFHGKVNEEMDDLTDQTWAADILSSRNGRWTYRNRNQKLRPGDVLYYWTTARFNGVDHHNYNQRYQVESSNGGRSQQHIDLKGKDGSNGNIVVNGQPTINIFVA